MNEELKDLIADLVTEKRFAHPFLSRVFDLPRGAWLAVRDWSATNAELTDALVKTGGTGLTVTWLQHPLSHESDYLLVFYLDDEMESTVAIVTHACLDRLGIGTSRLSTEKESVKPAKALAK